MACLRSLELRRTELRSLRQSLQARLNLILNTNHKPVPITMFVIINAVHDGACVRARRRVHG